MSRLLFLFVITPLSYLPISVLHRIADVLFFLVYHVFSYRKKLVWQNMRRSFPEKSDQEIDMICKQFFKHFCDVLVEIVKLFNMRPEELKKRVRFTNPELLSDYIQGGRSVIITSGHCGNWEWAVTALGLYLEHGIVAIYKRLSDPVLERKVKASRAQFGMQLVRKNDFSDFIKAAADTAYAYVFATDQSPSKRQQFYWTRFLNQETAVMRGAEIYAKRYDYVVVMTNIQRVKRGYYEIAFELVTDDPRSMPEDAILEAVTNRLEEQIHATPHNWLWTHKRWKLKRTEAEV
jgi:KDO2-lipid IV(A) lauroyltransferase